MTAARVGARSVVTSSGSSWTASIRTKNLASNKSVVISRQHRWSLVAADDCQITPLHKKAENPDL